MSIGQRIKSIRMQQGMTIDELAFRLNKNRTTIYRYENGDIENLPLGILDCLANALNTTPAHLMGWESSIQEDYTGYEEINKTEVRQVSEWCNEFGACAFNDEEHRKLMEYARFLLSIRETK